MEFKIYNHKFYSKGETQHGNVRLLLSIAKHGNNQTFTEFCGLFNNGTNNHFPWRIPRARFIEQVATVNLNDGELSKLSIQSSKN